MKSLTNDSANAQKLQKFGRFLSGMVMPNIGAFIAWGLITALFIPTGWLPNENLAALVGPMIVYLLPLLIGYTGGKMVYGTRGGVLGAVATMGVIVGTSIPMFIGGMIMGPIAGYLMKKFDESVDGKVPTGFEMLVNNFSAGILGTILTLLAYLGIGPVVEGVSNSFGAGVEGFVNAGLLPLASIFIEPAKILFLNNAINHGVLSPLGIEQAAETGKSIFFLLETNPGPGLGILLAYWVFSKGMIKQSAPGAIIIHFLGGIHEIYFPYILMQPTLLLAVIAGGASGVFTFVTFLVAAVLINKKGEQEDALTKAKENVSQMKNTNKTQIINKIDEDLDLSQVKCIAVACDAGMGSSAMGASKLKVALKDAKVNMEVINCSIDQLDDHSDLVITHEKLTNRAQSVVPGAIHISISDFINTDIYDRLAEKLALLHTTAEEAVENEDVYQPLKKQNIRIGLTSSTKEEAIRMAGQILFEGGYVEEGYIDAMVQRDSELSTYIGNGTAIPHGVSEAKKKIIKTGISILQFPEGVDFSGNTVYLVVGIAGVGNEHLMILSNLAEIVEDEEKIKQLSQTSDIDYIYKQFTN